MPTWTHAYEIKTEDCYKDSCFNVETLFDTRDYETNNSSLIKTGLHSKVLRMFKDEASCKQTVEVVNLKSYTLLVRNA